MLGVQTNQQMNQQVCAAFELVSTCVRGSTCSSSTGRRTVFSVVIVRRTALPHLKVQRSGFRAKSRLFAILDARLALGNLLDFLDHIVCGVYAGLVARAETHGLLGMLYRNQEW